MTGVQTCALPISDTFRQTLEKMSPSEARSVFESLPAARQQALKQQGYEPPKRPEHHGLFESIPLVGDALSSIPPDVIENTVLGNALHWTGQGIGYGMHAIGTATGPVGDWVMSGLETIGNFPGYLYRSIRQLDNPAQIAALLAGIAGATALAMTGVGAIGAAGIMKSLTELDMLGGAGLAAGAVGGIVADTVMGGTSDWINAFGHSWHGESTFDRP